MLFVIIYVLLLLLLYLFYYRKKTTHKIKSLAKTKSYPNINKISYTYKKLVSVVPKNSKSINYLDELLKNNSSNKLKCCNPNCKQKIVSTVYYAFDGCYCSSICRDLATVHISDYWNII